MKQCEQCGAIYPNRELHICGQNALVDMSRLRQRIEELEELIKSVRVIIAYPSAIEKGELAYLVEAIDDMMESDSG